jgi:hypothetical protein
VLHKSDDFAARNFSIREASGQTDKQHQTIEINAL